MGTLTGVGEFVVEIRENIRPPFPQGQSKLSVITKSPFQAGVRIQSGIWLAN